MEGGESYFREHSGSLWFFPVDQSSVNHPKAAVTCKTFYCSLVSPTKVKQSCTIENVESRCSSAVVDGIYLTPRQASQAFVKVTCTVTRGGTCSD